MHEAFAFFLEQKQVSKKRNRNKVVPIRPPIEDTRTPFQRFVDLGISNGPNDWKEKVTSDGFHCSVLAGCVLAAMPGNDGVRVSYDCATLRLADFNAKSPYAQVQMIVTHPSQLGLDGKFKS